jgi:CPA1 family monovalent cation:H+ antiporter
VDTAVNESLSISYNLEQFLIVLSVSLSIATLSKTVPILRKIPYTLLLVIVGMALAFVDVKLINLSPELIMEIFLPPLLFEAAWNLQWRNLKQNWFPIILFATLGVVICVVGIAFPLSYWGGMELAIAFLAAAALSATDPVSVIALFKELGASKKLNTLMEGESLFNDGVAVVVFLILVGIPLGTSTFDLSVTLARFVTVIGIGVGCGLVIGFSLSLLTQRFDLPFVEQSLTLVSAYGAYILAENLGGSGVIGVVVVGMVLGNYGSRIGMNPRTRLIVSIFWEFVAFFVNSIIFLLIGDQIGLSSLSDHLNLILIAIAGVVVTRLVSIFALSFISNKVSDQISSTHITLQEQTVLWWGGLRGSVAIAVALSVPQAIAERQAIIDIVFGVVLFTLLVQGLTTQFVLKGLDLIGDQPQRLEYAELVSRQIALRRVLAEIQKSDQFPDINPERLRYKQELVQGQLQSVTDKLKLLLQEYPLLQEVANKKFDQTVLDIEAETYADLIRMGRLEENIMPLLVTLEGENVAEQSQV